MGMPCAIFWDIESIEVPRGQSADSLVKLIRSTVLGPYKLKEMFFYCVCDVRKLPAAVGQSLTSLDVNIIQAYNKKDSVDKKIADLMKKFVESIGKECGIILLSGSGDYSEALINLKNLCNISIYLIRLLKSFPSKLEKISQANFFLVDNKIIPVESAGQPPGFIMIKNYPKSRDPRSVMTDLSGLTKSHGGIKGSTILFGDSVCIGFPSAWLAIKAVDELNGSLYHKYFLEFELLDDSPLNEILKCIQSGKGGSSQDVDDEMKKLTFIKIDNSGDLVSDEKFINFCVACIVPSGIRCILSCKSSIWIVFAYDSHAKNFLTKLKILYGNAVISDPLVDNLLSSCSDDPFTVTPCELSELNGSTVLVIPPVAPVEVQCKKNLDSSKIAKLASRPNAPRTSNSSKSNYNQSNNNSNNKSKNHKLINNRAEFFKNQRNKPGKKVQPKARGKSTKTAQGKNANKKTNKTAQTSNKQVAHHGNQKQNQRHQNNNKSNCQQNQCQTNAGKSSDVKPKVSGVNERESKKRDFSSPPFTPHKKIKVEILE